MSDLYRILIVDDEPIVHGMIERVLDGCEMPVRLVGATSSGEEALSLAKRLRPDICLLDIHMAEMDGLELANRLPEELGYLPAIIYVTAYRKFEYARQAVRLGAMDYIVKPIRKADVLDAVGKAVRRIQAERLEKLEKEHLKETVQAVMPAVVTKTGPADETRRHAIARAAREYVDKHFPERLTLTTAADALNLSPGYLGPIFKAEYGLPFKAYLRRVRIARAKDLMKNPSLNLSQIAERVGFDDVSYFSQSFYEETGVRPSEYRGGGKRWPK